MWKIGETIGDREGRLDACVAAAGIMPNPEPCLTYSAERFQQVSVCRARYYPVAVTIYIRRCSNRRINIVIRTLQTFDVNVNGALFTAQAAGRQMERFGNGGSIILMASVAGHVAIQVSFKFDVF